MHMQFLSVLATVVSIAGLGTARAEDASAPGTLPSTLSSLSQPAGSGTAAASSAGSGTASAASATELPPPLPLMPEMLPGATPAPAASQSGSAAVPPTHHTPAPAKGTSEQLHNSIRIRELKTQVLDSDPSIDAWRQVANRARTPNGRRVAMRNYYTLLFTQIEKLDPSLTAAAELLLFQQLSPLEQPALKPAKLIENIAELPGSHAADHDPAKTAPKPAAQGTPPPPHQSRTPPQILSPSRSQR